MSEAGCQRDDGWLPGVGCEGRWLWRRMDRGIGEEAARGSGERVLKFLHISHFNATRQMSLIFNAFKSFKIMS